MKNKKHWLDVSALIHSHREIHRFGENELNCAIAVFMQSIDDSVAASADLLLSRGMDERTVWSAFRATILLVQNCTVARDDDPSADSTERGN